MWITVDPEMAWISLMNIQQPDTIWQNVLNYERDPVAQIKVIYMLLSSNHVYCHSNRVCCRGNIFPSLFIIGY